MIQLAFELNGLPVITQVEAHERLIDVLRDRLGFTGTKEGCGAGECGACTVLVNGRVLNACLCFALEVEGAAVTTVEGLVDQNGNLSPVQQAFVDASGAQCGFCTPGMILSAVGLLGENPRPNEAEVREALRGNLCRCTGYVQIIESVLLAAERQSEGAKS